LPLTVVAGALGFKGLKACNIVTVLESALNPNEFLA